jgi:hypothetical protein
MFWVCFTAIGIADIVMLLLGEVLDRSFFMDIVLDSLKKKLAQISNLNPEKGHFCIWAMPDPVWPIMKFKQIISSDCHVQFTAHIWPRTTSGFVGI